MNTASQEKAAACPKDSKDRRDRGGVLVFTERRYNSCMTLKEAFQKYFVPHPGNDHRPHLLRVECMTALALVAIFCQAALLCQVAFLMAKPGFAAAILPSVLVDITNQDRLGHTGKVQIEPGPGISLRILSRERRFRDPEPECGILHGIHG